MKPAHFGAARRRGLGALLLGLLREEVDNGGFICSNVEPGGSWPLAPSKTSLIFSVLALANLVVDLRLPEELVLRHAALLRPASTSFSVTIPSRPRLRSWNFCFSRFGHRLLDGRRALVVSDSNIVERDHRVRGRLTRRPCAAAGARAAAGASSPVANRR